MNMIVKKKGAPPNIARALNRVAGNPERPLNWVLDFWQDTALDSLRERDWKYLQEEVAIFVYGGLGISFDSGTIEFRASNKELRIPIDLVTKSKVRLYQEYVKSFFETLEASRTSSTLSIEPMLQPPSYGGNLKLSFGPQKALVQITVPSPYELFLTLLHLLAAKFSSKLRQCSAVTCQKWFLAKRTNKFFHTRRCTNREMARRHRKTPPDRIEKRGRPKGSKNKPKVASTKIKGEAHARKKPGPSRTTKRVR